MERSLIATTVERYTDRLRPFLDSRNSADGPALELANLSPADIISFVVARCPRQNSGMAKLTVTALRSFLGFLHLEGITERSLVCAVPSVARRRLVLGLPKGLEPDQVQRLLASRLCKYSRRLSGPCHSDPAGPAGTTTRRGRKAHVGRYRLASGHDRSARQGKLYRTHSLAAGRRSQAGRIPGTGPPHERTGGCIRKVRSSLITISPRLA